ncbi:gibberellin-regulated protein [Trifolium repens]|nr:gibberellin-regulated protein [Trifolium repens]
MSMLQNMASKSIILLGIFLVVTTKVFSHDEDLKIVVNYANPSVPSVKAPPSPVVAVPTPPSPVKALPSPPSPVKTPPYQSPPIVKQPSPPLVKTPPYQSPPIVKPPSPPLVKTPPYQSPPILKPPTPPPLVKSPPYQSPPIVKPPTPQPPVAPTTPPTPIVKSWKDCIPLCENRCKLHSRKNICARACMTCCDRCKCVPPGTYGNREKCGKCYTDMLTHGNKFKCP